MTEKDLLLRLETICRWYRVFSRDVPPHLTQGAPSHDEVGACMVYLAGKIRNDRFNREDLDQWEEVKRILYNRLENKSPQTMFELSLGLPEGVGTVVLDEITYGRMFMNEYHEIGLRQ